jgi:hypothetical protein
MNKNLFRYPSYAAWSLDHELRHSGKFSKKDLGMDMFEGDLWDTLSFCFRHPKAFWQFLPIGWYKREFFVDVNLCIIYFTIFVLVSWIVYLI